MYECFTYRYSKYQQMVCEGLIEPEKLPPTERAAWFHGLRVHLQTIQWKILDDTINLEPEKWGWKKDNGVLVPIPTDKEIAPPDLLQIVRCKCKMSSRNPCGTNVCSCRKNGILCMPACGGCHGEDCNNKQVFRISNNITQKPNNLTQNLPWHKYAE